MAFLQLKTFSKTLRKKTDIQVILPTPLAGEIMDGAMSSQFERSKMSGHGLDYYSEELRCPVLYLLHGGYGDDGDWMRFSRIESYAQNYNLCVVMADAENSCYRNMPRGGPQYYDYFTKELPEMIRWMFPVSTRREDTFVVGLSMGGAGAFKLGMSKPEMYGYVASLSGGFGHGLTMAREGGPSALAFAPDERTEGTLDDPLWLSAQLVEKGVDYPKYYMCCGTEDFVYPGNVELKEHLDRIGFHYIYHEQPGVHNWDFWDDEIQRILEWLPLQHR
ncbi:alpha/beta hydrolase [Feifania hominis]|uniref:Esterase family protein n=1 Tax=Feifania hominis TaxID=2763660 RepID=A0A926DD71_9FIRM|nr:alpha/beta hydrolase family protein [Feifania hominis]MBC8536041.1 esterase family protein [Feifania hominis]